jgi:hypothetical protein
MRCFVARSWSQRNVGLWKIVVRCAQPPNVDENSATHGDPLPTASPSGLGVVAGAPVRRFGPDRIEPKNTLDLVFFFRIYFELIQMNLKSSKNHSNSNKFRKNMKPLVLVEFKEFL